MNSHIPLLLATLAACQPRPASTPAPPPFPQERVEERGIIDICIYHNFTDYYLRDGDPRGFHHELLADFTRHARLKPHVETSANFDEALLGLAGDNYDLVAMSLSPTPARRQNVAFTRPLFHTRWVIARGSQTPPVDSLRQLHGREIYHQPGSEARRRLEQLRDSLGITLHIIEATGRTTEELLLMVNNGEIPLLVTTEHVARAATRGMTRIDHSLHLPGAFPVAWALPREAAYLLEEINTWLEQLEKTGRLAAIRDRYFNNPVPRAFPRRDTWRLSPYDTLIRQHARLVDWDWRLLAALVHRESRFHPAAISGFGAVGLMQIMPGTAATLGLPAYQTPEDNLRAGTAYIRQLQQYFSRYPLHPDERLKFILAAYNAGPGHVADAMRLAEARDDDPYTWDNNVEYYLLNKSKPEYNQNPAVRNGYCDGQQVVTYVNTIIDTYQHYKNIIPE